MFEEPATEPELLNAGSVQVNEIGPGIILLIVVIKRESTRLLIVAGGLNPAMRGTDHGCAGA